MMDLVTTSGNRKPLHIVALGWVCVSSILLWARGRDLLEWAFHAPLWQLILLQIFNSALSSAVVVELLPSVIGASQRWNQRQRRRALLYTWGIVFFVSSAMVMYGSLSVDRA